MDHNPAEPVCVLGSRPMRVSVTEAKGQLTELVRRAEAGEEVVLTRHGQATVRLAPVRRRPDADKRRAVIAAVQAAARKRMAELSKACGEAGERATDSDAARSQDFLYDEDGLPN